MNEPVSARKHSGLSQDRMTAYLTITRSQLNMAERGERYLTAAAAIKLAFLLRFILLDTPPTYRTITEPANLTE